MERFRSIIPEPPDMCLLRAFGFLVLCSQLNSIGLLLYSLVFPIGFCLVNDVPVFIQILPLCVRHVNRIAIIICHRYGFRVSSKHVERLAWIDDTASNINISSSIPFLHHPMGEDFTFRCLDCRLGNCL